MGIIATLLKLAGAKVDTFGNAPGESAIAQGEGFADQTVNVEVYQAPGVFALPPDGVRGVRIPVGGSGRYGVVVAVHNYAVSFDIEKGEACLYATNAEGDTIKGRVTVKADGSIRAENDNGFFKLADDGGFSANGNLEVDP